MKINKLKFKNINSLAGDWEIDFSAPEFSAGLFALTGPTGAGKTSVLDAVCLAMFGRTPRQTVSSNANEVMTRGTGESEAKVEMELDGERYLFSWSQRRARAAAVGNLQNPERSIDRFNRQTGEFENLASQIRSVNDMVEKITGMNFEQFTRAVLLAQGAFDAFLKADDNGRAAILDQVTGTEIYQKLSIEVHTRLKTENQKLDNLLKEHQGIKLLTPEELEALKIQRRELEENINRRAAEIRELDKKLAWLNRLCELRRQRDELQTGRTQLVTDLDTARQTLDNLARAGKARSLDPLLERLKNACENVKRIQGQSEKNQAQIQEKDEQLKKLKPQIEAANTALETAKSEQEKITPLCDQADKLDHELDKAKIELRNAQKTAAEAGKELNQAKQALTDANTKKGNAETTRNNAEAYLTAHAGDKELGTTIPVIETEVRSWKQEKTTAAVALNKSGEKKNAEIAEQKNAELSQKTLAEINAASDKAAADRENAKPALALAQETLKNAEAAITQAEKELEDKEAELESAIEEAGKARAQAAVIADLTERRKELQDGLPCPLCGAEYHPYAAGNVPELSAADKLLKELQEQLKRLKDNRKKAEKVHKQAFEPLQAEVTRQGKLAEAVTGAGHRKELAENNLKAAEKSLQEAANAAAEASQAAAEAQAKVDGLWQAVAAKLAAAGIAEPQPAKLEEYIKELAGRRDKYAAQERTAADAKAEIQAFTTAAAAAEERVKTAIAKKQKTTAVVTAAETGLNDLKKQRTELFGNKKPREERQKAQTQVEAARKKFDDLNQTKATAEASLKVYHENLGKYQQDFGEASGTQATQLAATNAALTEHGFVNADAAPDLQACLAARLDDESFNAARVLANELNTRQARQDILEKQNRDALAAAEAENLTGQTAEELEAIKTAASGARDENIQAKTLLDADLERDTENRTLYAQAEIEINAQQAVFARWTRLHNLIGSADGKKFQRYAQGITLNLLLQVANRQLEIMNPRYELFWDPVGEVLLPQVLDREQGNVLRPVSNLSGGETFMVSLALALALSSLNSGNLKLESMFLDEGFGTLDDTSLEQALGALDSQRLGSGKLIGIISHVERLKERVPVQIRIVKQSGGRSRIEGPGCSRLSTPATAVKDGTKNKRNDKKAAPTAETAMAPAEAQPVTTD